MRGATAAMSPTTWYRTPSPRRCCGTTSYAIRPRCPAGQPLQVEFLANGSGLHLLRVGGSPYAARIADLQRAHSNLRLLACHEAMERMHERGLNVVLLPNVEVAPSAEGQLAQRLTQGWRYVQA